VPTEPSPLAGRTVLVTGAAHGIGAQTARLVHSRGAVLALAGADLPGLRCLAGDLGPGAIALRADPRDPDAVLREACDGLGGVDVLVLDAGAAGPADVPEQWRAIRAALPVLVERRGHVVVVGSSHSLVQGMLDATYGGPAGGVEPGRALGPDGSGTVAGLVHVGFVDADLAANALAPSHVDALRRARSALRPRPVPVADAAAAIVRGIELRCPGGAAPGWVVLALALRGLLGPVARPYPVRAAAPAVAGVAPVAGVRAERG
jgi:NAD(P)-dependent dehydrogenase (short-subunit alcohol dehydrogenase family)